MFSAPDTETPVVVFVTIKFFSTMLDAPAWNWNPSARTAPWTPNTAPFALPMICTAFVSVPESPPVNTMALATS